MTGITDSLWNAYNKVDRDWMDRSKVSMHNWGHVKSVHSHHKKHGDLGTVKSLSKAGMAVGSGAFSTATNTGFSTMAYTAATGGTVALSATGVGAVAVAGTYAVGSSVLAGVSAYKTHNHIKNLQDIQRRNTRGFCDGCKGEHSLIKNTILPYIIEKKKRKLRRKGEETVPLLGSLCTTAETGMRSIYKRIAGTRGKERHYYAQVLTVHLITCTCDLAEDIVSELWSHEEMKAIRAMDSDEAGYWIFSKMASM